MSAFAIRVRKPDERVNIDPEQRISMLELLRGDNEMKRGVCAMMMSVGELTEMQVPTTKENVLWWANENSARYEREMDLILEEAKIN